jgi:coenzyme F420-reducing hydrogenase alpha subunit
MAERREVHIHVPVLARVEGEGALEIELRAGRIETLRLCLFEPPRLFEKLLEGRDGHELPDLVARICGICPVAYQLTAVQAVERILGLEPGPWVRAMRRALYCGEWIQSHSLHIHLLALPDFLGCESVIELARDRPAEVRRGLRLQALGNRIIRLFGARAVHPVGVRIGGFHHAPAPTAVRETVDELRAALPLAEELVRWVAGLDLPRTEQEFTSVALRHAHDYPLEQGRIVSDRGLDIAPAEFERHFAEHQVPHSTALHCLLDGRPYLVGPLARLNLNADRLPQPSRALLDSIGLRLPSRNLFDSLAARALEIHCALHEAIRLLADYRPPEMPYVNAVPRAGDGCGATEAPRGVLWHRYELAADGRVRAARIVPPTSQNQARIEDDLRLSLAAAGLERGADELRRHSETVIRNYDPCISCAAHFLDLRVQRLD